MSSIGGDYLISRELINRINALAKKQKESGLTEEEQKEQQELRKEYLKAVREQVISQLGPPPKKHSHSCGCGCKDEKHS